MSRWYGLFQKLISNTAFQSTACADGQHQVFLFQALLSALIASSIDPERVCLLPKTYNYPYHLHDRIPPDSRLAALNDAVCFTYEDLSIHPEQVSGIEIRDPLRSWLMSRLPG
jgi:hypothetical protein